MKLTASQPVVLLGDGMRVELAADAAEAKWHLLFPLGATKHRKDFPAGGITFSADMLRSMVSNWEAEGKPERQVNYFHRGATAAGDATPIEAKIASGWIKAVAFSEKTDLGPKAGLYAQISWTPRAKAFIAADELRYLSPEFSLGRMSTRTGKEQGPTLLGAALLNDPFLTELPRVAASETPMEGGSMDPKKLRSLLKLAEDATDEQVEAALSKAGEVKPEQPVQLAELTDTVAKLSAELTASKNEVAALKTADRKAKVEAFVSDLVKAGKIAPAIRENVLKLGEAGGIEAIKFFESAPAQVSTKEIGISAGTDSEKAERDAAGKKFLALADEIHAKGGSYKSAYDAAKAQLPKEFALYRGDA